MKDRDKIKLFGSLFCSCHITQEEYIDLIQDIFKKPPTKDTWNYTLPEFPQISIPGIPYCFS